MKRIISLSILLTVFLAAFAQGRFKEIEKCFNEPASRSILIVSHRADWRNAPENSLQAIQNCIDMGADMVEIDLNCIEICLNILFVFAILFLCCFG